MISWCISLISYGTLSFILSLSQAVWSSDGQEVVYPCHAIIISMTLSSGQQRFFIGHTDKVFLTNTHTVILSLFSGVMHVK